jgi:hypothetical protein
MLSLHGLLRSNLFFSVCVRTFHVVAKPFKSSSYRRISSRAARSQTCPCTRNDPIKAILKGSRRRQSFFQSILLFWNRTSLSEPPSYPRNSISYFGPPNVTGDERTYSRCSQPRQIAATSIVLQLHWLSYGRLSGSLGLGSVSILRTAKNLIALYPGRRDGFVNRASWAGFR